MTEKTEKKKRWLQRIQNTKRHYSFQKWSDKRSNEKKLPIRLLSWIKDDIFYLVKWNINLLLNLRTYGTLIKKKSGLTYFQQWKRMAYLAFSVRTDTRAFRSYNLFDQHRWQEKDKFSFGRHYSILRRFSGFLCEGESNFINNKFDFCQLCKKNGWYTPEIHGIVEKGRLIYPREKNPKLPPKDLFVKELAGGRGDGAKYFKFTGNSYTDLKGKTFSEDEILSYLKEGSRRSSLIIQDAVKNHDNWRKFSNGSLATCRIVTGRSPKDHEEIILFLAALRMPVEKSDADNFSLSGIAAQIDIQTGTLGKAVRSTPINNSFSFDFQPDTGGKITGSKLYRWDDLVEFTKMLHREYQTLCLGWDVTLSEQGLCVIEVNDSWGSDVVEAPGNKLLYDTEYPEWVESWIEILTNQSTQSSQ